jgi:peptide/nickel transport system substrate-binding protein
LLERSGWVAGSDGIRAKGGVRLSFTIITQAGFAIRENVSQALQQQFRDIGVDAKVQLVDGTSISSLWFKGDFDAMLHWWQQGADPEITLFFAGDRAPPNGRNINYLVDEALTTLLYRSDRTVNEQERVALLREAQRRVAELAPEIPLYNTAKIDAIPASLQHFTGNPTNAGPFWNVYQWEFAAR